MAINMLENRRRMMAAQPHKEMESGGIVSFSADNMLPLAGCKVDIEPVQDLHGYDSPWPAGGGVNKFDEEMELGGISSSDGSEYSSNNSLRTKNYIPVTAGEKYYFLCPVNGTRCFYDENKQWISTGYSGNVEITAPTNAHYFRFSLASSYGTTYNHNIAINYPSSVTTYSPYSNICPISGHDSVKVTVSPTTDATDGTVYDITFPTEAGTIYGGTLDVVRGTLMVTHGVKVLNGSETYYWSPNNALAQIAVPNGIVTDAVTQFNVYTKNSVFQDKSWAARATVDGTIGMFYGLSYLYVKYSKITSVADVQAFFTENPTTVVYELATPITYTLTPAEITTLLGTNNIWADTGDITVTRWTH